VLESRGVYGFFLGGLADFRAFFSKCAGGRVLVLLAFVGFSFCGTVSAGGLIVAFGPGSNDCKRRHKLIEFQKRD